MRQAIALAVVAGLSLASCGEDDPDLTRSAWKALEVEYCLASGETKMWGSADPAVMENLRRAMNPGPHKGLSMLLLSYTNEIRLELASGQKWRLYYRDSPRQLSFHDPDNVKRSFVASVSGELYTALGSALSAAGGGSISLKGDCRISSMKGK
jgi:hypothetical protein